MSKELIANFWSKVLVSKPDRRWEWMAAKNRTGYGVFYDPRRGLVRAHRFAFEVSVNKIPKGHNVCHKCDNTSCVNPAHLFSGTQSQNLLDMSKKGRHVGFRKLTISNVKAIRRLFPRVKAKLLAEKFGVRTSSIYHVITKHTWKNIS